MYVMTYPENPGEEFPSEAWLRALTPGLHQAVTQGDDAGGGGSLPSATRAGLQGLPHWLASPPPSLTRWPGDMSAFDGFLRES